MPVSLKPEALKSSGPVVAAGGGLSALAAAIIYAVVELHGGSGGSKATQATVDTKQDMQIAYNKQGIEEIRRDLREIKRDQKALLKEIRDLDR